MSPTLQIFATLLLAFAGCTIIGGSLVWGIVIYRLANGQPVLRHEPRRLATWGLIDIPILIVLMAVVFTAALVTAKSAGWLEDEPLETLDDAEPIIRMRLMLLESCAMLVASGLTAAFIWVRSQCSLTDMGISLVKLFDDIKLGAAAFAALAIPTYVIQLILVQFWPSKHPLIETLKEMKSPEFLGIAMFAAVIAAPLWEEFAFRGLFQGWLEKLFDPWIAMRPRPVLGLLVGEFPSNHSANDSQIVEATLTESGKEIPLPPLDPGIAYEPYAPPQAMYAPVAHSMKPGLDWYDDHPPLLATDLLSISISAIVFALMHFSHGPDWIPLVVLALGIGYLYRRTHRLTPGIVVHFLLNGFSMLATCIEIYQ